MLADVQIPSCVTCYKFGTSKQYLSYLYNPVTSSLMLHLLREIFAFTIVLMKTFDPSR